MACAGQGSLVLAALSGICVSRICIPGYKLPWEEDFSDFQYPPELASGLKIAVRGSDGFSDYGNCFGVPGLGGFFRSFGSRLPNGRRIEPIKPVAYIGGHGVIDTRHTKKKEAVKGLKIVRIGGPARDVGYLGGAASSIGQGKTSVKVSRRSVQRGDPEMERKAYEVIRTCIAMGIANIIDSTHDQGAGGPGNVLKELVEKTGGKVYLRRINVDDSALSVAKIWVAEYQEGFAFLAHKDKTPEFKAICVRENVNCEILGEVTGDGRFVVIDENDDSTPVDFDLDFILGKVPQKTFTDDHVDLGLKPAKFPSDLTLKQALYQVLRDWSVACKSWLTDKGDQTVLGRTAQQQRVGPLGIPLANCSVSALSPLDIVGVVSALGENPRRLMVDPVAGGHMAIGEMLTNIIWAPLTDVRDICCSANWMWAPKVRGERAAMCDTATGGRDFMTRLRIVINGGKDSLSMTAQVLEEIVVSLRQLVIGGYVGCPDITRCITPDIKRAGDSILILADPSFGQARLGGSTFAYVYGGQYGNVSPDIEDVEVFASALQATQEFIKKDLILSGHDISDGGLAVTASEMAFGGNCGLDLDIRGKNPVLDQMLAEEIGLVYEVDSKNEDQVLTALEGAGVPAQVIGKTTCKKNISLRYNGSSELDIPMTTLREWWMEPSYQMEARQSNPKTAKEKYRTLNEGQKPRYVLSFEPKPTPPNIMTKTNKYSTFILRDEGTNGYDEMTYAAYLAGLDPKDVHMTDLIGNKTTLDDCRFLITPGGFPHKDVPEAGKATAAKIKFNERVWETTRRFLERSDTLSLGVCSGCQINTLLGIVPRFGLSPEKQPRLTTNLSEKFESKQVNLKIGNSPSILHRKMAGSIMGAWVAHKQGRFLFPDKSILEWIRENNLITMTYVDHNGNDTQTYPLNPNGSPHAIAGLTTLDGRHTVCMPHLVDRGFQTWQWGWIPDEFKDLQSAPGLQMFQNAREWLEQN